MMSGGNTISPDQIQTAGDIAELLKDKSWRMSNLYYIKDKDGKKVKFKPNINQINLNENKALRNIVLKSRQLGFTTYIQIDMLDECLFRANTNAGVIAHNLDDAIAFFKDKIKYAYDSLPPFLREMISAKNDSARELSFSNGSVIRVGTSLRSGTFQILHISEYGKLCAKYPERALEVQTGAFPAVPKTGTIWIESTAEGRSGDFYERSTTARRAADSGFELTDLDFKFHFYAWHDDSGNTLDQTPMGIHVYDVYFADLDKRGIKLSQPQKNWYAAISSNLGDKMKREHPSHPDEAFEAAVLGAYFQRQMAQIRAKRQICKVPIEPRIPILTFWDLGRDTTSIWFFQQVGFEYRFFDYYQNSGEWMAHYLQVLSDRRSGGERYLYGDVYLPHDGTRKSIASDDSPADILFENGYTVRIVPRTQDKSISIERARGSLPTCYFDAELCLDGIKCLDGYRKEWDDKLGVWKNQPLHDANSHGTDAFLTWADGWHHQIDIEENNDELRGDRSGRNATTGY